MGNVTANCVHRQYVCICLFVCTEGDWSLDWLKQLLPMNPRTPHCEHTSTNCTPLQLDASRDGLIRPSTMKGTFSAYHEERLPSTTSRRPIKVNAADQGLSSVGTIKTRGVKDDRNAPDTLYSGHLRARCISCRPVRPHKIPLR